MSTWVKAAGAASGAKGWVKTGGKWVPMEVPAGLKGLGGWADITAVTGNPTKHAYTANGEDWVAYEFRADSSITTTAGVLDVFLISGGGSAGGNNAWFGSGGRVINGVKPITAGVHPVAIGAGGTPGGGTNPYGRPSSIGTDLVTGVALGNCPFGTGANGTMGNLNQGITTSITGTPRTFGVADHSDTPNTGDGAVGTTNGPGASGIVIVRVPKDHAKA